MLVTEASELSMIEAIIHLIDEDLSIDRIIDYDTMSARTGCHDRGRICSAVRIANRKFQKRSESPRSLINVPTVGYRIIHPNETPEVIKKRVAKGDRQIRYGIETLRGADLSLCSPEERNKIDKSLNILAAMRSDIRRHQRRLDHHESLIKDTGKRVDALENHSLSPEQYARLIKLLED